MAANNFKEWFSDAEMLYSQSLAEYQEMEEQIDRLEQQLVAKRNEVNQIGQVLGKPALDGRRLPAQLLDAPGSASSTIAATIHRAINGRGLGRG